MRGNWFGCGYGGYQFSGPRNGLGVLSGKMRKRKKEIKRNLQINKGEEEARKEQVEKGMRERERERR